MTHKLGPALFVLLLTLAYAQEWTVQTVALQDYQEALETAAQLQALEYDAYVDFGLYEGRQFVRVRVGCFADQDSADFFARQLAGRVTAEAVAVPLETKPGASFCVQRVVGFELPESWAVLSNTASSLTFWVEVLGQRRFVMFTGQLGASRSRRKNSRASALPRPRLKQRRFSSRTRPLASCATGAERPWRSQPEDCCGNGARGQSSWKAARLRRII